MPLEKVITGHHTVWISLADRRSVPIRYATSDESLICFGDGDLYSVVAGTELRCTVHEIACGPPLLTFDAVVSDVAGTDLTLSTIAAVHGNAPDPSPFGSPYRHLQQTRRFVALTPTS